MLIFSHVLNTGWRSSGVSYKAFLIPAW